MMKIGLLSDTHSFFDTRFYELFKEVDEIWHAGDIGNEEVLNLMEAFKPTRAVFGNIDGASLRKRLKEVERFSCENVNVLMTHIGGYPGKYQPVVKNAMLLNPPKLLVCGHSHILKVIYDKQFDVLHVNPGSAGKSGFHTIRTAVRFAIDGDQIKDMEVIELGRKNDVVELPKP